MPCTSPLKAWRNLSGNIVFHCSIREERIFETLSLPCGQCISCRLAHSREWAVRCTHEAQMHSANCWITLTYRDDALTFLGDGSATLWRRDVTLFLKKLRKEIDPIKIRYFGCGEYGTKFERPHYHLVIFGYDFPDKCLYKAGRFDLFNSELLSKCWKLGHAVIADFSFESAAYTARYCVKKINGANAGEHYHDRVPEFSLSSNRPGIGATFFQRYSADIVFEDQVISRGGKASKPPRYYDKLLGRMDPELLERNKQRRKDNIVEVDEDRLKVLEKFNILKFEQMVRNYERGTIKND